MLYLSVNAWSFGVRRIWSRIRVLVKNWYLRCNIIYRCSVFVLMRFYIIFTILLWKISNTEINWKMCPLSPHILSLRLSVGWDSWIYRFCLPKMGTFQPLFIQTYFLGGPHSLFLLGLQIFGYNSWYCATSSRGLMYYFQSYFSLSASDWIISIS